MEMQGSYLMVKRDKPETQVYGSKLLLAENRVEDSYVATVLAKGPGKLLVTGSEEEMNIEVGDRVIVLHGQGVPMGENLILEIDQVEASIHDELPDVVPEPESVIIRATYAF